MNQEPYIIIEDFCQCYSAEVSFLLELNENGMIELTSIDTSYFVHHDDISHVEKYIHLHYD